MPLADYNKPELDGSSRNQYKDAPTSDFESDGRPLGELEAPRAELEAHQRAEHEGTAAEQARGGL